MRNPARCLCHDYNEMQIELVTNNQVYQVIILKRIIEKQVTRAFSVRYWMSLRRDMHLNGRFNIFKLINAQWHSLFVFCRPERESHWSAGGETLTAKLEICEQVKETESRGE